jgi:hypothetical protein
MSLKKFSVGTLQSKKLSIYKFSSNRLSLRRFPFPAGPATSAIYVEDVFSAYLYTGNGGYDVIENGIPLASGPLQVGGSVLVPGGSPSFGPNAGNANYAFGTGDFTVEGFINFGFLPVGADGSTGDGIFTLQDGVNGGWGLVASNDGVGTNIRFSFYQDTSLVTQGTVTNFPLNTWRHVAVTRQSNTFRIFVNGILVSSGTSAANLSLTNPIIVGYSARTAAYPRACFSNVRAVKGTALYTDAFTPPTSALTAVSGTVLLFCQGATPLVDNSSIGAAISQGAINNVKTFGPFAGSTVTGEGLVWLKGRSVISSHFLNDTTRGATKDLSTNTTSGENTVLAGLSVFNTNGFTIGSAAGINLSPERYVSWTFRKQPKFFDVVTYTGTGTARTIAHNLGSTPGCVIVKRTNSTGDWAVYHRGLTSASQNIYLNLTNDASTATSIWNSTAPTSTEFSVGTATVVNANGGTYVAYLFAHDAGGFGAAGTDNVITCGTYLGSNHRSKQVVELGYEPQWLLIKNITSSGQRWVMVDNMRSMASSTSARDSWLISNSNVAETTSVNDQIVAAPNGFYFNGPESDVNEAGSSFIYIAIRRGPMKVPTSGTSVFSPVARTGTGSAASIIAGFPPDMSIITRRTSVTPFFNDKFRGASAYLGTVSGGGTAAEVWDAETVNSFGQNGISVGSNSSFNLNAATIINWLFRRAPGFFDIVTYIGTGAARTITHNLSAVPELMIFRNRIDPQNWAVYSATFGPTFKIYLNTSSARTTATVDIFNNTAPTSSVFSVGNDGETNASAQTFVAYLFASCPGVSKVGSYTGTGTTQVINCGFTSGARFVMIKRTDDVGDWYIWDSARGIVAGNDPYILLNVSAAEVTNTDYIDPVNSGFEISSTAPAAINANGGSYIFLAIA